LERDWGEEDAVWYVRSVKEEEGEDGEDGEENEGRNEYEGAEVEAENRRQVGMNGRFDLLKQRYRIIFIVCILHVVGSVWL
jgi:hypothetical protein